MQYMQQELMHPVGDNREEDLWERKTSGDDSKLEILLIALTLKLGS